MPRTPRMKMKAVKVFGAKKEVTKADAKKLKPLTEYWSNRLNRDNWYIFLFGLVYGFLLGLFV